MLLEFYTPEQQDRLAKIINKGGFVSMEAEESRIWCDVMDLEHRELTLMMAGFTGLTNEELETNGTLYFPVAKKNILAELIEALRNELQGYGMDDSTMFTIGYKDGTVKTYSHDDSDITLKRPLTDNQYCSTQEKIIRSSLNLRNIDFIIMSNGYQEPVYFVTKEGIPALKQYGNFEKWYKGVGEKRRDYIQDEWL